MTGSRIGTTGSEHGRKEVVIENDIAWRIASMVDFMFGTPVRLESLSEDGAQRERVEAILERVWERSGGISLMQDMATIGHVYGHVDLLVRVDEALLASSTLETAHEAFAIELVEPRRGVPALSGDDYRVLDGYVIRGTREHAAQEEAGGSRGRSTALERILGIGGSRSSSTGGTAKHGARVEVDEYLTRDGWHVVEGGKVVSSGERGVLRGVVPVVHIQNMSQPFEYSGIGEVEGLIPLQDELNTRLSDRANRVTLQSFKMYLARGIDGFDAMGVGPGTVWSTDNPDASITGFGGDAQSPSEDRHIDEIRDAMDKVSGVPPLAGGVVKARLGNLSSANALRVTLMGLIAKTQRKRVGYGRGIESVCSLVLWALSDAGVLRSTERDRGVRVRWGAIGPIGEIDALETAQAQIDLGADRGGVVEGLGLDERDPGVV